MSETTLPYNGVRLDREGARRADPEWVDRVRSAPGSTAIPLWQDKCLVADGSLVRAEPVADSVFLGTLDGAGVFATDLSDLDEQEALRRTGATAAVDVRTLFTTLDPAEGAALAYARGILHWSRNQRFCGKCGATTEARNGGHMKACQVCGKLWFPRIEPAVIVLVESADEPGRCLLGRHRGAAEGSYSTLAGFVEIGEGLEDAVRREVSEEAGVRVGRVEYLASQAWPFPAGLMLGFRATALSDDIAVDRDELVDARWFTPQEVAEMQDEHVRRGTHRGDSIEQFLIDSWLVSRRG